MGEISEMIMDGTLCDVCGAFNGDKKLRELGCEIEGSWIKTTPGYPVTCDDCAPASNQKADE